MYKKNKYVVNVVLPAVKHSLTHGKRLLLNCVL